MVYFKVGQDIKIRCKVSPGPFSEQRIVTFESISGSISGFIDIEDIEKDEAGNTYLRGIVEDTRVDAVKVRIKGSFFTTNGLAEVPRAMVAAA